MCESSLSFFPPQYGLVSDPLSECTPLKLAVSKHPHASLGERVMLKISAFVGEPHQSTEGCLSEQRQWSSNRAFDHPRHSDH